MSDEDLPDGAIDLWPALHDAFLRKVHTDVKASSVLVAVENADLNGFHGFPEGGEFELRFSGTNSLEIVVSRAYEPVGESLHRKRRHESGSWHAFEATFNDDHALFPHGRYEIYRGHVEPGNQMATLVIQVLDYRSFEENCDEFLTLLRLTSEALDILDPSGRIHTVESFLALGTAYWDD